MNDWHLFSLEFRAWTQHLLEALRSTALPGVALVTQDRRRVICSQRELHYEDAPCRSCRQSGQCPVPRWLTSTSVESPPGLPVLECESADEMPTCLLIGLGHLLPGLAEQAKGELAGISRVLSRTWCDWHYRETQLNELARAMTMADTMSKLSYHGSNEAEVAGQLDKNLKEGCQVQRWAILLKDCSHWQLVAPSRTAIHESIMSDLGLELCAFDEIQLGDVLLVSEHPELFLKVAPVLSYSQSTHQSDAVTNVVVLPFLREYSKADVSPNRLHLLLAAFPARMQLPGPIYDRMRLLCQLALTAWESAHRLAEAERKETLVHGSIRALPGFEMLVGEAPVMAELRMAILRAARSDRTVLLVGEQGTGKELVAKLIHRHSRQGDIKQICVRVADELAGGFQIWKSYHPSQMKMEEIVATEFRDVPLMRLADISKEHSVWRPDDVPLRQIIEAEEGKLPQFYRYIYRSVIRVLYKAWQADPFFNLFEFDSGAATTQQIAAELFGFAAKRFTDVVGGPGRFQTASHCGGSLFLDNIHHLDLSVQRALLKATEIRHEDRRVSRAGAAGWEPIYVRLITATTMDLRSLVAKEQFLGELGSRLMCEVVLLPPLNDRRDDISLLASHFARLWGKTMDEKAVNPLLGADWRGLNVRGLQNVVESAAARSDESVIRLKDIQEVMAAHFQKVPERPVSDEELMIRKAIQESRGSISHAAKRIGWSRQKLYRLVKKHAIES
jgi:DNA-binding NtrC family response regulator